jgi:starch synthase
MRIAYVTPEVLPFSKTGGLADVSQALPSALAAQGVHCTVFTPLYRQAAEWLSRHGRMTRDFDLNGGARISGGERPLRYRILEAGAVTVVFVVNEWYYDRPHCYLAASGGDYDDNVARFAFFCRAVLEFYLEESTAPDVFHVHDWQTALIPVYLKTSYHRAPLADSRCLLTIHNLGYPGIFPAEQLPATGLDWDVFTMDQLEYYGQLNLLKGGIVFADAVNTVSPSYALEIQSPEFGGGLDGVLAHHRAKLSGILNGINEDQWNPATDPHLNKHYSSAEFSGKQACKRALQRELGLPLRPRTLLLGAISRLDRQKGIQLLIDTFARIAGQDLQLAVLGTGDSNLESQLAQLARDNPEQVALRLGYEEPLAHRIIAGADAFVMPSLYEPCGLTQMYSQRYGTVPIVRATGGLRDTVRDYASARAAGPPGGFAFEPADRRALAEAVRRALELYFTNRRAWNKLARGLMQVDHSWRSSAAAYLKLYQRIAVHRGGAQEAGHG